MVKSIRGKAKSQCKGLEVRHSRDTGRPVWLNGISKEESSRSCCQKGNGGGCSKGGLWLLLCERYKAFAEFAQRVTWSDLCCAECGFGLKERWKWRLFQ